MLGYFDQCVTKPFARADEGGGNCVGGTDGAEIVKLGSTFGAAVQRGSLTMHCNKVFSLQICGLVLDCVCGAVGVVT